MAVSKVKYRQKDQQVLAKLSNMTGNTRQSIRRGFFKYGRIWKKEAVDSTKRAKTGNEYTFRRGKRGRLRRYRASAPGESHANRTGALTKSLGWKVNGTTEMLLGYGIDKSAPVYSGAIELGRKDGSILPRPTIKNALDSTERDLTKILLNSIDRTL